MFKKVEETMPMIKRDVEDIKKWTFKMKNIMSLIKYTLNEIASRLDIEKD